MIAMSEAEVALLRAADAYVRAVLAKQKLSSLEELKAKRRAKTAAKGHLIRTWRRLQREATAEVSP